MSYEHLDPDRIKVHDLVEYYEGGVLVASVSAEFDLSKVDERYRDVLIDIITSKRFRHFGISISQTKKWEEYRKEDLEWRKLSFFKRIFTPRPEMPGLE